MMLFKNNYIIDLLNAKKNSKPWQYGQLFASLPENPNGKINLLNQRTFNCHRSGWNYAMESLRPLHSRGGILFDGFVEHNFSWTHMTTEVRPPEVLERMKQDGTFDKHATSEEKGITPYTEPWVGFVHNPQGMPGWFHYEDSPQNIFSKKIWQDSLEYCIGLFTLSEYHAKWLRGQTGKPVSTLMHPTEFPQVMFDFQRFLKNPQKNIIQIGWWLRRLNSIYRLPIPKSNPLKYKKIRLVPLFSSNARAHLNEIRERELLEHNLEIEPAFAANTREIIHVSDRKYDNYLAKNIVFVHLYDANANNVVIECIARTTPLLVNPLPAVVEYLGEEYPMYFSTLEEAAEKAMDTDLILETHNYLKTVESRAKLTGEYFEKSFEESEVYQLI